MSVTHDKLPQEHDQAQHEGPADTGQALSRLALDGVGVSAEHFYGADDHFMGVTPDGEYRVIITRAAAEPSTRNEMVGTGRTTEDALHDSLEAMRHLETVRTKTLARIEMGGGTAVDFTALEHYAPKAAPGRDVYPVPQHLEGLLADDMGSDLTYQRTIAEKGWQAGLRGFVETYVADDPVGKDLAAGLKIRSLSHLTPEQAVKLSTAMVQNLSKYSFGDIAATDETRADQSTAGALLREGMERKGDPEWEGNGVCRNIASTVKAVFESLKATQAELSMLNNTYAVYGSGMAGAGYRDARQDGIITPPNSAGHAWDTFVTVDAKGSAAVTIIDATWALGADAGNAIEHLDQTELRAASVVRKLFDTSDDKAKTFQGISDFTSGLIQKSRRLKGLQPHGQNDLREHAVTQLLSAGAQLSSIEEDYELPDQVRTAAYKMRGRLDPQELATLYKLDGGVAYADDEWYARLIKDYDGDRRLPVSIEVSGDFLVFGDDNLQDIALSAVGAERVQQLAGESGKFRARLRERQPDALPA